jgi:hypothetical protein
MAAAFISASIEAGISFAVMSAGYIANAVEAAASAFATGLAFTAAFISARIQAVISFAVMSAGYISLAASALWAGGQMAIAWLIGLGPIAWIGLAIGALVALIYYYWDDIVLITKKLWAKMVILFDAGVQWIIKAWNFLKDNAATIGKLIITALFPVAGLYLFRKEIMATLKFLYDQFKNTDFGKAIIDSFIRMKDAAIQLFRDMIGSVGDRFNTLFDFERIKTIVVDSLNEVIHKINNTMGSIPIISSAWVNIPDIPGRELGGAVQANKMYRVNERQDEFFKPSQSGTVIPLNQMSNYTPASGGKGGNSFNINVKIESAGEGYDAYALVEKIKDLLSSPNELAQQRAELGLA